MSLEIQTQTLNRLLEAGIQIPGLSVNEIAPTFVEMKFGALLDGTENREAEKQKVVDYYKTEGRSIIEDNINNIKTSAEQLTKGLLAVPVTIAGIVATAAVPTSLAAAVPMVSSLTSFIDGLKVQSISLLKSANAIGFVLPDPIFALISGVEKLYSLIPKL